MDEMESGPGGGLTDLVDRVLGSAPAAATPAPAPAPMFELALDLGAEVDIGEIRDLSDSEILEIPERESGPGDGMLAPTVQLLRARHHEIARLLAAGLKVSEVCEIVGVTPTTVNRLRRTPAFGDLLFSYMSARDRAAVDLGARIKGVAALALDKLGEKLEAPAQALPLEALQRTTLGLLDRAGHSPVQKTTSVNLGLTADDIRRIKLERAAAGPGLLDHSQPMASEPALGPEGGGISLSEVGLAPPAPAED